MNILYPAAALHLVLVMAESIAGFALVPVSRSFFLLHSHDTYPKEYPPLPPSSLSVQGSMQKWHTNWTTELQTACWYRAVDG